MKTANYYEILGLRPSATQDEIRRAYRVLARRFHPDVNPGEKSGEKFKLVAHAYNILSDSNKRAAYDLEIETTLRNFAHASYRTQQQRHGRRATREHYESLQRKIQEEVNRRKAEAKSEYQRSSESFGGVLKDAGAILGKSLKWISHQIGSFTHGFKSAEFVADRIRESFGKKISVIEVSLTVHEAISGLKKTIEVSEPEGPRKVSVTIPPGVRNGSVIHMRSDDNKGEDMILIVRIASHPFMSVGPKGIIVEIPITIHEAVCGASIKVPTLENPAIIKVPPGTQSGTELRVKEAGPLMKDGTKGDIFYRVMIRVPESSLAVGIKEKTSDLDNYYEQSVRAKIPEDLHQI